MDIIVVEGIHDYALIKKIYPTSIVITTNGSEISPETLKLLATYSKDNEIIIFTDPDYPGERIRKKIKEVCPQAKEAFIPKNVCISKNKRKVGVEHASEAAIKAALANVYTNSSTFKFWDLRKLIALGLADQEQASNRRAYLASRLNIGNPNTKTLINRLNSFGITEEKVKELLEEYGN